MESKPDIFALHGKTALITGAGGYLGAAISAGLARAGAHVMLNGRQAEPLETLAATLNDQGLSAETALFDITDETAVSAFFKARQAAPLHVLVNNAYRGGAGTLITSEDQAYAESYNITIIAAQRLVKHALPGLHAAAANGGASIINIASMYALVSPDQKIYGAAENANPPYYGAAKAALLQWTRYAACELGPRGIRVNAISPGPFPSSDVQKDDPAFASTLAEKTPLGRLGVPEELSGPVVFLASAASSYVNGENLVVDGGWTCW